MEEQPESSRSLQTLKKITQNMRQNSAGGEPSNRHSPDTRREDQSGAWEEKNCSDHTPPESEKPKKLRRVCQKKAQSLGEFKVPPQVVLDASSAKSVRKNYPIWFSLVLDKREGNARPLPQIAASYLRIKDGSIQVSFIQKYLKVKLDLKSEDEVEIKCMGQPVIPTLSLNNLVDLWFQTTTNERVSATIGSSAKDFVMVLGYARIAPVS